MKRERVCDELCFKGFNKGHPFFPLEGNKKEAN